MKYKKLMAHLLIMMMVFSSVAFAADDSSVYYRVNEDFEGEVDSTLKGWALDKGDRGDTWEITVEKENDGNQVMRWNVIKNMDTVRKIQKHFTPIQSNADVIVEFKVKAGQDDKDLTIRLNDDANSEMLNVTMQAGGSLQFKTAPNVFERIRDAWSANVWLALKLEINLKGNYYNVFIDNTLVRSRLPFNPIGASGDLGMLHFNPTRLQGDDFYFDFDDIKINVVGETEAPPLPEPEPDLPSDVTGGGSAVEAPVPEDGMPQEEVEVEGIKVRLGGRLLDFDQPPIMISDRVLVPMRVIFEALGCTVDWDAETQTVFAAGNNLSITLHPEDPNIYIGETILKVDQPPTIINGRTLVPVRFISEALGADVDWNSETETVLITLAASGDHYVTPQGAGRKDGSSWENAMDANKKNGLQIAWDMTGEESTLYIGSGTYDVVQSLTITVNNDGKDENALKTIQGVDTGEGLPYFKGNCIVPTDMRDKTRFIFADTGSSYWAVNDLKISNYLNGIYTDGKNVCIRIKNFDGSYVSDGIYLKGGASSVTLEQAANKEYNTDGSNDIIIEDVDFSHYTKRVVRVIGGNYNVVLKNCTGDGGGKDFWHPGNFPISFQVGEATQDDQRAENKIVYDYNVEFYDCIGSNNYHDNGTAYWNADGFAAERASDNIKFYRCMGIENTDGGWDIKSKRAYLYDCVAIGNKRGFRFWSEEIAELNNCITLYSYLHGGGVTQVGVWGASENDGYPHANLVLNNCTIYNNDREQIRNEGTAIITLNDCIIGHDNETKNTMYKGDVILNDCVEFIRGLGGVDPNFEDPIREWDGKGTNWNSNTYRGRKGYYFSTEGNYNTSQDQDLEDE